MRYARLLDQAPFCVITFDAAGMITGINRAGQRMLWYAEAELVGRMPYPNLHDEDEVAAHARELSYELGDTVAAGLPALTAKPKLGVPEDREWTYLRRGGSRLPVHLTLTAMTDGGEVNLETGFPYETVRALMRKGHRVVFADGPYGGYQAILRDPDTGVYYGASESRKDGQAAGY